MVKSEKDNLRAKLWHKNNREKAIARNKQWKIDNKAKVQAYHKKYYQDNPEAYYKANMKIMNKMGEIFDMSGWMYAHSLLSWSKLVRKLDNYMCKNCGSTENIQAHHIQPKILFPELSLTLNNGVTLCFKCHRLVHG